MKGMETMNTYELGHKLSGTIIPVTTPFTEDFNVDYDALKKLMRFYPENGLRCFIAAGSTGQCYVLSENEHRRVVRTIVEKCKHMRDALCLVHVPTLLRLFQTGLQIFALKKARMLFL